MSDFTCDPLGRRALGRCLGVADYRHQREYRNKNLPRRGLLHDRSFYQCENLACIAWIAIFANRRAGQSQRTVGAAPPGLESLQMR